MLLGSAERGGRAPPERESPAAVVQVAEQLDRLMTCDHLAHHQRAVGTLLWRIILICYVSYVPHAEIYEMRPRARTGDHDIDVRRAHRCARIRAGLR
jgi:hypothetical protein